MRSLPQRVYFIHLPRHKSVKIGYSTNPARRLQEMQTLLPVPVFLIGTVLGGAELEREYHERFKRYRTRGEWFSDHILPLVRRDILKTDDHGVNDPELSQFAGHLTEP